jgi:hypothetical protein
MSKIENNQMHTFGRANYLETDKRDSVVFMRKQGLVTLREISLAMRRKINPVVKSEFTEKIPCLI